MGAEITLGNPPIAVTMRRSARARRLSLRVSRLDGRVSLTLPKRAPEREALAFLAEREDWLRRQLAGIATTRVPCFGEAFPICGRHVVLRPADIKRPMLEEDALILPADPNRLTPRLQAFLKTLARDRLASACDRFSKSLGRPYGRITLRDTRSRWGSCSSSGDLMFSWRLVMAPPEILDYVAAHEVAHLRHMDHSPAFWACCSDLYGDTSAARRWLRVEGTKLHAWQFGKN